LGGSATTVLLSSASSFQPTHASIQGRAGSPPPAIAGDEPSQSTHVDLVLALVAADWAKPHQLVAGVDLGSVRKVSRVFQKKQSMFDLVHVNVAADLYLDPLVSKTG
jgi:hypothetical protein